MIASATPTSAVHGTKKNSADLVTETDQAVEKIISTSLREKYPDFAFMGEETYKPGDKLTEAPTCTTYPLLTYATDRFPAMSGLAKVLSARIGADFVAGIWSDAFIDGLAWQLKEARRKPELLDISIGNRYLEVRY